ncbi:MAG: hypothetical protein IKF38_01255 [Clostridia bacterium]|nr:hypothetical protein [Clostridia bacterium]
MVEYAEIKKPNYSDVLETVLKDWYSKSFAENYAGSFAESLYEVMDFPQDGIYYVNPKTNTIFFFSKETKKWTDTKKSFEDYVIDSTSKIWDTLFSRHPNLKKASEPIKSVIKEQTQKMFDVANWSHVCSFDLETNSAIAQDQLSQSLIFLREYFSEKKANDIYNDVMKILFSNSSNNTIVILNNGVLNGMLSYEGFTQFNELTFSKLENYFSEWLQNAEMPTFMERLKNLLIWGLPYTSIIKSEQGTAYYMERNGLKLVTYDREHFYAEEIPDDIYEEFIKKCRVTSSRYNVKHDGFRMTYNLDIQISSPDEIICEKYGIKIPVENSFGELYVSTDTGHQYCFARGRTDPTATDIRSDRVIIVGSDDVDKAKNIEVTLI